MLRLNVLGPPQAFIRGEEIKEFRTTKVKALLVYLALEPDAHRREALTELLWPGMPERSARLNLRQILFQLRNIVSDLKSVDRSEEATVSFVVANRKNIQRNAAASVSIDSEKFDALIDSTIAHEHPDILICHDCQEKLEEAIVLYRDNFLADFYLEDSNTFEHWAQVKRELYARRALDALEILSTIYTREKNFSRARTLVERQLEIDDLREGAYQQMMKVLALAGRREEALRVYERCRRLLVDELGMEPSRGTTELYEKILAGELTFDTPVARGVRGYELKEEIGRGTAGVIHRAVQPAIQREVAVKVIRRRYANDPEFIRRFEVEAQTIASLEHPHIVPLYDYWRDPDGAYLVMRYLKGGNLLSALESGLWDTGSAARMLNQVCAALSAAHRNGVVHRDIKPANILLDGDGNAFLADFGIAKSLGEQAQMTAAGGLLGTPDYISPEQIQNDSVTPQSDIYSLGAVLYETLTGEKPYPDASVANLLFKHVNEPVPSIATSRSDLPPQVDDVVQKAMAKRPVDRYGDALEMAEAFQAALQGSYSTGVDSGITEIFPEIEVYNPYKGLRAFREADSDDFFGREALVDQLVNHLGSSRFLALVGPSGSGKSSAVKAGLIPALRAGAIGPKDNAAGSNHWFVAEMVPGTHPLEELEVALWPVAVDPPPSLVAPMERDTRGLLRTLRRILPDEEGAQLLLVIDQFEELFTLVEDPERQAFFIDSLLQALAAPRTPLRVVVTLRADFYDRPLQIDTLGALVRDNTVVVLPLSTDELTWAIREPARRLGIGLEPGLIQTIIADVAEQPGSLPLLQYTLTELFDRRENRTMTRAAYEKIGGLRGTLSRRADAIYNELGSAGQAATHQLFLRLVTLGEGVEDTRRRVLRSELEAIGRNSQKGANDPLQTPFSTVINSFGEARLLTFDQDPKSRQPTVEVAHEALLRVWARLRSWLEKSRADIRSQRQLAQAGKAWLAADKDDSYLLRGSRLDQFAAWATNSAVSLTSGEQDFLEASLAAQRVRRETEAARQQQEMENARRLAEIEQARAEAERQRAEEESRSAKRFRTLAGVLAGVVVIAVMLAGAAVFQAEQANQQGALAAASEAEAIAEAELRALAQAEAEREADIAFSRELAAASLSSLSDDPERSILLALEALAITETVAAENALHKAVLSSRIRDRMDIPGPGRAYYLDLSPDGRRLYSSGENGGVLWDVETGQVLHKRDIDGWFPQAQFTPDGQYLLIPTEEYAKPDEGIVLVLDAESGEERFRFQAHDSSVYYLALSEDGNRLATGSAEGTVRLWDWPATVAAESGQLAHTLPVERGFIWGLSFSRDGSMVAASSHDGTAMVWDSETGEPLHELFNEPRILTQVVFSPDGQHLLVGGAGGSIDIWNLDSGQLVTSVVTHANVVQDVEFDASGEMVATAGNDGLAKLWRYSAGSLQEMFVLSGHTDRLRAVEFSREGRELFTSSADGTIRRWDLSPQRFEEIMALQGEDVFASVMDLNGDWTRLATNGQDDTVIIWDADSGRPLHVLAGHAGRVNRVVFSRDGRLLATASEDLTARVWDVETGTELITLEGHTEGNIGNFFMGLTDVDFSPDSSRLATAGADGTVRVWELENGNEMATITGHPQGYGMFRVTFSPDGLLLLTGSDDFQEDGLVKLWDAETGQDLYTFGDGRIIIGTVAFSPAGDRIGIADRSGQVDVWQLPEDVEGFASGGVERLFSVPVHASATFGLLFTADGNQIVTTGNDGKIAFQDAWTGEPLLTINHPVGFWETALSPDGRWLAVLGDGQIYRFALDLDELTAIARSRVTRSLTEAECQQFLRKAGCTAADGG